MAKIRIDKGFGERMNRSSSCGRQPSQTFGKPSRPPSRPASTGSSVGKIFAAVGVVLTVIAASAAAFVGSFQKGDDSQVRTFPAVDPTVSNFLVSPAVSTAKPETDASVAFTESREQPDLPPSARAAVCPAGLWRFDEPVGETAVDSAGANHGEVKGAVRTQGKLKGALSFDGKYDRVDFTTNLAHLAGALTVAAWVKPVTPPTGTGRVIANTYRYDANRQYRGWLLGNQYGSSDQLYFHVSSPTGGVAAVYCNNFFRDWSNKWVHVAGVFKPAVSGRNGSLALYTNGVCVGRPTPTVFTAIGYTNVTSLKIGMRAGSTSYSGLWSGLIDEVAVYGEALSPEDIQAIATAK